MAKEKREVGFCRLSLFFSRLPVNGSVVVPRPLKRSGRVSIPDKVAAAASSSHARGGASASAAVPAAAAARLVRLGAHGVMVGAGHRGCERNGEVGLCHLYKRQFYSTARRRTVAPNSPIIRP